MVCLVKKNTRWYAGERKCHRLCFHPLWDSSLDRTSCRIGQRHIFPFLKQVTFFSWVCLLSNLSFPKTLNSCTSPLAQTKRNTASHLTLLHDLMPSCANLHFLEEGRWKHDEKVDWWMRQGNADTPQEEEGTLHYCATACQIFTSITVNTFQTQKDKAWGYTEAWQRVKNQWSS